MSEHTTIEWTDISRSPWRVCTPVSPGCKNCYAEKLHRRLGGKWGKGIPRIKCLGFAEACRRDNARAAKLGMKLKVFPSIMDWLDEEVPIEWLAELLQVIHDCPQLIFQLLTKRPELWRDRIALAMVWLDRRVPTASFVSAVMMTPEERVKYRRSLESLMLVNWLEGFAPENVWVGVSVENQEWADKRVPELLKIPAAVRFLSVEPLLGAIQLNLAQRREGAKGIDWVIVGGESGTDARICEIYYIRDLIIQCKDAKIAVFVKQLGRRPQPQEWWDESQTPHLRRFIRDPKGGDMAEWPADLRVREFPIHE